MLQDISGKDVDYFERREALQLIYLIFLASLQTFATIPTCLVGGVLGEWLGRNNNIHNLHQYFDQSPPH